MAKVKYCAKENTRMGTHSWYAAPVFNGVLEFDEVIREACKHTDITPSIMRAAVTEYMDAVQNNALKGFRVKVGEDFLTVYPNLTQSVRDYEDKETHQTVVATAKMVKANNAKSHLGCTVSAKFSAKFASEVSWQKVDNAGNTIEEEDITQDNDNTGGPSSEG